jgi:hypothetical protein
VVRASLWTLFYAAIIPAQFVLGAVLTPTINAASPAQITHFARFAGWAGAGVLATVALVGVLSLTRVLRDSMSSMRKSFEYGAKSKGLSAAKAWLAAIDAGEYAQSWEMGYFLRTITREEWGSRLEKVRRPLGKVLARELAATNVSTTRRRFVAKYVFATSLEGLPAARETVTFAVEPNLGWKAIGYLIRPADAPEEDPRGGEQGVCLSDERLLREELKRPEVKAKVAAQQQGLAGKGLAAALLRSRQWGRVLVIMVSSLLLLCGIYSGINRYLRIPSANEQKAQPAQSPIFTTVVERRGGETGLLQITSLTNNPQGVKIRYKLVQNGATNANTRQTTVHTNDTTVAASGVPPLSYQWVFNPTSNATSPNLQTEPPKLRFVAWQDEWKTNQPGAARHPDGSSVTNATELKWLKQINFGGMDVSSMHLSPEPRFLRLWFSHPLFDQSSMVDKVTLLDDQNNVIPPGANGAMSGTAQEPNGQNGNLGWQVKALSPGAGTNLPHRITVRLRYTVGPLERTQELAVESKHHTSMTLEGDSQLNGVGQNVDGQAFVAIAVDAGRLKSRRFGVVAVTKDGHELTTSPSETSFAGDAGVSVAVFEFNVPLADLARFIIGTRPVHTMEWKDVVLPTTPAAPAAGGSQKQPSAR